MSIQTIEKKKLYFVTDNKNKFSEAEFIFKDSPYELVQYPLDLPEYQGTSEEIAFLKCLEVEKQLTDKNIYPFIIEDTGLHYNCLNGLPGPYIKWFLKQTKLDGLVKLAEPYPDKSAYAQCIVTLNLNKGVKPLSFKGVVNGNIVTPRGTTTFGWDPIFQPDLKANGSVNYQTFAEIPNEEKNKISHRYKAFLELKRFLHYN